MRPEIQRLIDIATKQEWRICYSEPYGKYLSTSEDSYPQIFSDGGKMSRYGDFVDFNDAERIAVRYLYEQRGQKEEAIRARNSWECLVDFLEQSKHV